MKIFAVTIRKMMIYVFTLLLAVSVPVSVMAEVPVTTTPATTAPVIPAPPATTYSYDVATGRWSTNKWTYDPATGTYIAVPQPAPAPAPVVADPVVTPPVVAPTTVVEQPTTPTGLAAPTIITPQTPAPADNTINSNQNTTNTLNSANQTNATNNIGAQSQTGNATVILNTAAGNATTGDATAATTILNEVNSTLSTPNNQKAASFVTDVMGNVNGDIVLKPMLLKAMLESGTVNTNNTATANANITNTTALTNNVDLGATTGNAGVVGNTKAGNATSGTANTVANVVNIINSMVAANQSFIGTVNIYGNLNGDILIAPDFIPQLIASNGNTVNNSATKAVAIINAKDMQSVINNVSLAAQTGKAAVMNNTSAGNATSGKADTNVVIFNLSGHEIVASNSLLVFVNVLGKWVGVIVDAPVGATAAAIGNGITTNKVATADLTLVSNNTSQITNNINLNSQSGNATVAGNTQAGNAATGNATASANIANMTNSQFGLSGWFGVLFINVFGSWFGSFGIDTPNGNPIVNSMSNSQNQRVIEFIPSTEPTKKPSNVTYVSMNSDNGYSAVSLQSQPKAAKVLGAASITKGPGISPVNRLAPSGVNVPMLAGSFFLIAISAASMNRFRLARKAI